MLKNKKCQALLIAASAFIGIEGNVYGSNYPTIDDIELMDKQIAEVQDIRMIINSTKDDLCSKYYQKSISLYGLKNSVLDLLVTYSRKLDLMVYDPCIAHNGYNPGRSVSQEVYQSRYSAKTITCQSMLESINALIFNLQRSSSENEVLKILSLGV